MQYKGFHNNIVFRITWPLLFGALIYLLILLLNNNLNQLGTSFFSQELAFTVGITYMVFEVNKYVIVLADKLSSIGITLLINILVTALVVAGTVTFYFLVILGFSSMGIFSEELTTFTIIFCGVSLVYNSMVIGNQYLFRENQDLISSERILTENLELELIKYQNDVNPDLFYDSLESLISLLRKDPFEAEDYIDKLALVYRHILSNKNAELTNFDKELDAVRNLVFLLNEKYGNTIQLINNLDEQISDKWVVVPGSLAKLVESVIRGTIITTIQPLNLILEFESDDYFVLCHKLNQKLRTEDDNTINDIQVAYSIFTEKPVITIKAYGENHIKIPILVLDEALPI